MGGGVLGVGSGDVYVGDRKWERLAGEGIRANAHDWSEGTRVETPM